MADKERTSHGPHLFTTIGVDSGVVIEKGDFVYRAAAADVAADANVTTTGYGITGSHVADAGDAAANRAAAAAQLVGIAMDPSASGETDPIRVSYDGVFILDQESAAAIHIGDNIEIYASATAPSDDSIVEGNTSVIGTCIETKTSTSETEVLVRLQPPLMNV